MCEGVGWGQCGVFEGTGKINIGRLVQGVFGLVVVWDFFWGGGLQGFHGPQCHVIELSSIQIYLKLPLYSKPLKCHL